MALIDIEGGDHLQASLFTTKGWSANPGAIGAGRVRGSSWQLTTQFASPPPITKVLPASYASVVMGIGFMFVPDPAIAGQPTSNLSICNLQTNTGATIASVSTNASSRLQVTNSAGTVIATGTTVISINTWHYLELKLIVGTSGSCELHLDGVPGEISSTVGNFGTTNVARFQMTAAINEPGCMFDDWYLLDLTGSAPLNDFLGDVTIETLFPNADGTHQDWTPSAAGSHYNKVNEATPDGDTTYVSDISPGDIDTYTVGSLATLSGTVYGVATNLYARKDDAAGRQIAPVIREAGTDHVGATSGGLTTSYLFYRQLYPLDPAGAAWTIASVNGAEYGVKEVT